MQKYHGKVRFAVQVILCLSSCYEPEIILSGPRNYA